MKKPIILVAVIPAILFSCKKDEETTTETPKTTVCLIDEYTVKDKDGDFDERFRFSYNSSNRLTKVEYIDENGTVSSTEEITHDSNNMSKVIGKDNQGTATGEEFAYTYSGSDLSTVVEKEMKNGQMETTTFTYTYANGKLSKLTHDGEGGPNFDKIVWTDGNITAANLFFKENGIQVNVDVSVQYDSKPNIKARLINRGENAIEIINKNNLKYIIAEGDLALLNISKGDTLMERIYEYSGDAVSKITEEPGPFNENEKSITTLNTRCVTE